MFAFDEGAVRGHRIRLRLRSAVHVVTSVRSRSDKMLAEFSVVPIGKGESVSQYVAECVRIVHESGLDYRLNPMGTVVEGDYDQVMDVVRRCHLAVISKCQRVVTTIKIDDRVGAKGMIEGKLRSVEDRVGFKLKR